MSISRILAAIVLVALATAIVDDARACSCVSSPPPFCALDLDALEKGGSVIFVGTVRDQFPEAPPTLWTGGPQAWDFAGLRSVVDEMLALHEGWISPDDAARHRAASSLRELERASLALAWTQRSVFAVEEMLLGAPRDEVHVFSGYGGGDCGYGFQPGESYLVQALPIEGGQGFSANICSTRVRSLANAERDLRILRAWKEGVTLPREIVGDVQDWTTRGDSHPIGKRPPAANTRFSLDGPSGSIEFVTASQGAFQVQGLDPVEYSLRLLRPGWRLMGRERKFDLREAGCAEVSLWIEEEQGTISGRMVAQSGEALPKYLWVEAVPVDAKQPPPFDGAARAPDGKFEVDRIEPGAYRLAINFDNAPTGSHSPGAEYGRVWPYATTFYPGVTDAQAATVFAVDRGDRIEIGDWMLPHRLPELRLEGVAYMPDGSTARDVRIALLWKNGEVVSKAGPTAADGRFELWGLTGIAYSTEAVILGDGDTPFHRSHPIEILPDKSEPIRIRLEPTEASPEDLERFDPERW